MAQAKPGGFNPMQHSKPAFRTLAILAAAAFAIAVPVTQFALGVTPTGETKLVRDGDTTLEAAGYAFSIWSVIYAGLIAYAVYQALPSTRETPGLRALGWPSVAAMVGCGLWLIAAVYDIKLATMLIIIGSAAVLCLPLSRRYPVQHRIEFWLVAAPLSMLAGWLTVASAINTLTVLTGWGVIDAGSAPAWAAGGVIAVVLVGAVIAVMSKNWIYPLPMAWGLAAVWVAEQTDRPNVAILAAAGAAALLFTAIWVGTHKRLLLPLPRQQ
jgi:hypothetical protein